MLNNFSKLDMTQARFVCFPIPDSHLFTEQMHITTFMADSVLGPYDDSYELIRQNYCPYKTHSTGGKVNTS